MVSYRVLSLFRRPVRRSGRRFGRFASAQVNSPVCGITAVPPIVRVEGVAERMGDISCAAQGNRANRSRKSDGNLNTTITNRCCPTANSMRLFTANTGSGPTARIGGTARV